MKEKLGEHNVFLRWLADKLEQKAFKGVSIEKIREKKDGHQSRIEARS